MSVASNSTERRNPTLARVPFEALVEIAAPEGASFEAESIDLSASGMHLKTAYLPKVGTPLTFRFEANADAAPILAGG
ncbi:MAG: PilZ domain-containing protein, partial [Polyangiales bacterium]